MGLQVNGSYQDRFLVLETEIVKYNICSEVDNKIKIDQINKIFQVISQIQKEILPNNISEKLHKELSNLEGCFKLLKEGDILKKMSELREIVFPNNSYPYKGILAKVKELSKTVENNIQKHGAVNELASLDFQVLMNQLSQSAEMASATATAPAVSTQSVYASY